MEENVQRLNGHGLFLSLRESLLPIERWGTFYVQYHEVKLNFTFATAAEMALNGVDTSYTPTASLYVTYVFLDTDEREIPLRARAQKLRHYEAASKMLLCTLLRECLMLETRRTTHAPPIFRKEVDEEATESWWKSAA